MEKAIIFGCGEIGINTYFKIHTMYKIVAWADNNKNLWGKQKEGIVIISPKDMNSFINDEETIIFVAVAKPEEIVEQLLTYSLHNIYVWREGYFYYNFHTFQPLKSANAISMKKNNRDSKWILFVINSISGGIREHKRASILRDAGYKVFLAYLMPQPIEANVDYTNVYEKVFPIMSIQELIDLVNDGEFDLIHSSSEPEWVTSILNKSNKVIIHECHDLGSSNKVMSPEQLVIEYISHVSATGVIYPTEKLRNDAISKFGISKDKTFVVENFISEALIPTEKREKLSKIDGKIHAVYEGAIAEGDRENKRYFEDIWIKLATEGIHIHFYTNHSVKYCLYLESLHSNIHYEGNLSSKKLAIEMSQYDLGLLIFNVNNKNRRYLENASPNKMYEYINAGIPVATYGIETYRQFIEFNQLGKEIDFNNSLYPQFKNVAEIVVQEGILQEKKLTIESQKQEIIEFIEKCIARGRNIL